MGQSSSTSRDTVVIGGGLLGTATAWMIARDGGRVLLVERDQINQHASGSNAGSLHFQLEYRMIDRGVEGAKTAAEAMPLHLEAAKLWFELPDLTGESIEVKQTGGLMIAETSDQVALLEKKTEIERAWGLDNRVIDRTEIDRIAPYLSQSVIAAGVWTTRIGQMMGAHLPTIPLALMMTVTRKVPKLIPHLVQHAGGRLSLKQSLDGNVLIGGGWPARLIRDENGEPDFSIKPELLPSSLSGNADMAIRVLPELASVPAIRSWVGTTTVTEDQLPLVGAVPEMPGAFVATGGSAFTLGLSFAQVLATLVAGRTPDTDLLNFDPARYRRA